MISKKEDREGAVCATANPKTTRRRTDSKPRVRNAATHIARTDTIDDLAGDAREGGEVADCVSNGDGSENDVCEVCGLEDIEECDGPGRGGRGPQRNSLLSTLLICDGCDMAFHLFCLGKHDLSDLVCGFYSRCCETGLEEVPDGDWYCELCCRSFGISSYGHSALAQVTNRRSSCG